MAATQYIGPIQLEPTYMQRADIRGIWGAIRLSTVSFTFYFWETLQYQWLFSNSLNLFLISFLHSFLIGAIKQKFDALINI